MRMSLLRVQCQHGLRRLARPLAVRAQSTQGVPRHGHRPPLLQRLGQPTHATHAWKLGVHELTPGISASEYAARRNALADMLPAVGSTAVLFANDVKYMAGNIFYEFYQDPNFNYLTGLNEPDSAMVLTRDPRAAKGYRVWLFVRPKDPEAEIWEGPRTGLDAACDIFGADEAFPLRDLPGHLAEIGKSATTIYTDVKRIPQTCRHNIPEEKLRDIVPLVHELRLFKSPAELACLRKAGAITGRAFNTVMSRNYDEESVLQAELECAFRVGGCERPAYVPVVAAGESGCCIHYTVNDDRIQHGDSIMVDAGGSYGGYAADVTRCWPAAGRFVDPGFFDVYCSVLNVQRRLITMCSARANVSLHTLHRESVRLLEAELRNLSLRIDPVLLHRHIYPHYVGHHVGMEIHDAPSARSAAGYLQEGMVVALEPALYFSSLLPPDSIPSWLRGIAVRIEDTVAVGADTPTVMTVEAVKDPADIEGLRTRRALPRGHEHAGMVP